MLFLYWYWYASIPIDWFHNIKFEQQEIWNRVLWQTSSAYTHHHTAFPNANVFNWCLLLTQLSYWIEVSCCIHNVDENKRKLDRETNIWIHNSTKAFAVIVCASGKWLQRFQIQIQFKSWTNRCSLNKLLIIKSLHFHLCKYKNWFIGNFRSFGQLSMIQSIWVLFNSMHCWCITKYDGLYYIYRKNGWIGSPFFKIFFANYEKKKIVLDWMDSVELIKIFAFRTKHKFECILSKGQFL